MANELRLKIPTGVDEEKFIALIKELVKKAKQRDQDKIVFNVPDFPEIPEFPKIPDPVDYTSLLADFIDRSEKYHSEVLINIQAIHQSVNLLALEIKKQTDKLVKVQEEHNLNLSDLVTAYREPKKILRDRRGNIEGIE